MKKILFICTILFIASVACKKENVGGGGLCACSPIQVPTLNLVIKNSLGGDLLSDKITGYYEKSKIQITRKDAAGKVTAVDFNIRPPFSYGNEKFNYNYLLIPVGFLQAADDTLYLKLGDNKTYEIKVMLNQQKYDPDKITIDGKVVEKDKGTIANYTTLFYITE
ncbi:hypothetical protein MUGA111182_02450 [Mucilaginibacter galii]|uniref:Uncharacterized protein n=1 Tax=Mucilaginibacter galii TaxID=2005073 RepID=A0A917N187_9SPHI|nr:hypothetical protein [Mucilaginibacter galii]GGI50254.1 hypothetical protein GCM10011425_14660 [Mucilaginibacter galii]